MTLTRAFFFVLLLANIGLAVLLLGPMQNKSPFAGHTGEPERLSNQLNPERITLTAPTASGRAQPTAAIAVPLESVVATTSETAAASQSYHGVRGRGDDRLNGNTM